MNKKIKLIIAHALYMRPLAFIGIFITFVCYSFIAVKLNPVIEYDILKIVMGALSCGFIASASHGVNNIFDLKVDKINKPYRALPANEISLGFAWASTAIFYVLSILLALITSKTLLCLVLIMFLFTIIYSCPPFRFKRFGLISLLNIVIPRGFLIVLAGWSVVAKLNSIIPWFMALISMLYTFGASITKDIADIKGDEKNGRYSRIIERDQSRRHNIRG